MIEEDLMIIRVVHHSSLSTVYHLTQEVNHNSPAITDSISSVTILQQRR